MILLYNDLFLSGARISGTLSMLAHAQPPSHPVRSCLESTGETLEATSDTIDSVIMALDTAMTYLVNARDSAIVLIGGLDPHDSSLSVYSINCRHPLETRAGSNLARQGLETPPEAVCCD
jgi:hypothetical protein